MQGSVSFWSIRLTTLLIASSALSGCFDGEGKPIDVGAAAGTPGGVSAASSSQQSGVSTKNKVPLLSGSAPRTARVGQTYVFQPKVSDPDGDKLSFSVSSKPSWASFDPKTGRLWGTPAGSHLGSYEEISVSVTDGKATVALPEFEVVVVSPDSASSDATLAWDPPIENTDGTTLTDLTGYKIYYGTKSGQYTKSIPLTNPGLTRYMVENLSTGTYYFAITALSKSGGESEYSAEVAKKIS